MGGVGQSIAAVMFSIVGGVMNSTWPLFCKPESPRMMRVATVDGWQWENVWLPFTLWGALLNVILCVSTVGRTALSSVYREASSADLGLVCTFSFLWGAGTACFSLGIQLLGAGPGTALVMSLLVVIGTLLPLIEDHADDAGSPAALVTIVGLLFAISGFVSSAQSSRIKARAIEAADRHSQKSEAGGDTRVEGGVPPTDLEGSPAAANPDTSVSTTTTGSAVASGDDTRAAAAVEMTNVDGGTATRNKIHTGGGAQATTPGPPLAEDRDEVKGKGARTSHLTAIAVCVTGAVMSSMLQFSFVYGDPLITYAEEEAGVAGAAAPLVVWLLAFSLAAVWNVAYAVYLLCTNKTWGRYVWLGWADLIRKFRKITVMSVFFVGHIHFYGQSQHLFGDLGPVVAWPLIMSSTVLGGQIWSVFMKEWVGVPRLAMKVNIASICLLVTAVTIIAIAGAVL
ncbi:unnamed protein product [Scytosiphon promiscuus]